MLARGDEIAIRLRRCVAPADEPRGDDQHPEQPGGKAAYRARVGSLDGGGDLVVGRTWMVSDLTRLHVRFDLRPILGGLEGAISLERAAGCRFMSRRVSHTLRGT